MKRREFFKWLGVGAVSAVTKTPIEKTESKTADLRTPEGHLRVMEGYNTVSFQHGYNTAGTVEIEWLDLSDYGQ